MYPVSDAFLQAVQENGGLYYWTGRITTKSKVVHEFGPGDIVKGSGYISAQCCGGTETPLGTVYSAETEITLLSSIDRYTLEDALVELFYHLRLSDGTYEEVPMSADKMPISADKMPINDVKVPINLKENADKVPIQEKKHFGKQQMEILEYVAQNGKITTQEAAALLQVKQRRARSILSELVNAGELKKVGDYKSTVYIVVEDGFPGHRAYHISD